MRVTIICLAPAGFTYDVDELICKRDGEFLEENYKKLSCSTHF